MTTSTQPMPQPQTLRVARALVAGQGNKDLARQPLATTEAAVAGLNAERVAAGQDPISVQTVLALQAQAARGDVAVQLLWLAALALALGLEPDGQARQKAEQLHRLAADARGEVA